MKGKGKFEDDINVDVKTQGMSVWTGLLDPEAGSFEYGTESLVPHSGYLA